MKRKVLLIPFWYPTPENPASGIFIQEHAKAAALYNDVTVLFAAADRSLSWRWRATDALEQDIRTVRIRYGDPAWIKATYALYLASVLVWSLRLCRHGFRPDIIHAHVYHAGVPAVLLGCLLRVPVVLTENSTAFPRRSLGRIGRWKAKFAMERAALVLPVCLDLEEHIRAYGIRARFRIVPNVVDTKLFFPAPAIRRREGEPRRILTVALLHPRKGIPCLLEALCLVRQKREDFRLDIVGDGPYRMQYEQLAAELGLTEHVRFHGFQAKPAVAEFMRKADFFVLPSRAENLPVAIVEALASGKPVIASHVGGIPEMLDETSGCLVPPDDAPALAEAISAMLDSYGRYDATQIAASARERYSYEAVGKQLDEIYREAVARR